MNQQVPRLHAVTDNQVAAIEKLETIAAAIASTPGVALHARLPDADGRTLAILAQRFRRVTPTTLVNDRVDVALIIGAAGVHLPADGLPIAAARGLLTSGQLVGRSTHSPDEARRAVDEGADYVFLGPIWETGSHPGRPGLGPDVLRNLGAAKVIAIGGITPSRARQCREAGAWGVAAISALWRAPDPAAAAREMLLSLEG